MGYMNFCLTDRVSTMYTVMTHELLHIFGFNSKHFKLAFPQTFDGITKYGIGSLDRTVRFMRSHLGCPENTVFLSSGIPTYGSHHWDPTYVGNEIMIPCDTGSSLAEQRFSEITAMILEVLFLFFLDVCLFRPKRFTSTTSVFV